jgi:hypothetical protein
VGLADLYVAAVAAAVHHRINVGGKVLTNHLKEIISFRYNGRFPPMVPLESGSHHVRYCAQYVEHDGGDLSGQHREGEDVLRVARLHRRHA